ncbi:MAG: FHA domain-containing protein [Planctomycetota bacterium]
MDLLGFIEVLSGARQGTRLELDPRYLYEVGASEECHLELPGEGLATLHARLHVHEGRLVLTDLEAGATTINGFAVSGAVYVEPGDELGFASAKVRFAPGPPPASPPAGGTLAETCFVEPPAQGAPLPGEMRVPALEDDAPAGGDGAAPATGGVPTRVLPRSFELTDLERPSRHATTAEVPLLDATQLVGPPEDGRTAVLPIPDLPPDIGFGAPQAAATQVLRAPQLPPESEDDLSVTFAELPAFELGADPWREEFADRAELSALEEQVAALEAEAERLRHDAEGLRAEAARVPELLRDLASARGEVQRLELDASKARAQRLLGGEALEGAFVERDRLRAEVAELAGRAAAAETERGELTRDVARLRAALEEETRQRARAEQALSAALAEARQAAHAAEGRARLVAEERDASRADGDALREELAVARKEQQRLRELAETRAGELDRLLAAAQGERAALLQDALGERGTLRERIAGLEQELVRVRQARAAADARLREAGAALQRSTAENARLEAFAGDIEEELIAARALSASHREEAARVEGLVAELAVARDRAERQQEELRQARPRLTALAAERDDARRDADQAVRRVVELSERTERDGREGREELAALRGRADALGRELGDLRARLRASEEERGLHARRAQELQERVHQLSRRLGVQGRALAQHGLVPRPGGPPPGARPVGERPAGERPAGERPAGERPAVDRIGGAPPAGAGPRPSGRAPAARPAGPPAAGAGAGAAPAARRPKPAPHAPAPAPAPSRERPRAPRRQGLLLSQSFFERAGDVRGGEDRPSTRPSGRAPAARPSEADPAVKPVGGKAETRGASRGAAKGKSDAPAKGEPPARPAQGEAPAKPAQGGAPAKPAQGGAPAKPAQGGAPAKGAPGAKPRPTGKPPAKGGKRDDAGKGAKGGKPTGRGSKAQRRPGAE